MKGTYGALTVPDIHTWVTKTLTFLKGRPKKPEEQRRAVGA